jgi:MFS transporter, ACS family, tartrate transporter
MSEHQIFAKCGWRLITFMALLYMVKLIDWLNVGFAALRMNKDLGFSPAIFGFGAGILLWKPTHAHSETSCARRRPG